MVVGNAFCILLVVGALLIRSLRFNVSGGAYPGWGGGGMRASQGTFSNLFIYLLRNFCQHIYRHEYIVTVYF